MTDNSVLPIPTRFRATCELCRRDIDVRKEGTHQWTSGWVMVRSGGGGHGVSLPRRENRWACHWCVDSASKGTTHQAKLFG